MSSFLVSDEHITMMVSAAIRFGGYAGSPFSYYHGNPMNRHEVGHNRSEQTAMGRVLRAENVAGQVARYGDEDGNPPYAYPNAAFISGRQATQVEVLKGISCYEYQACESPDWGTSEAKTICDTLTACVIRSLPGYEDAPWEWNVKTDDNSHIVRLI